MVVQLELAWFELSCVSKLNSEELAFKLTDQALSAVLRLRKCESHFRQLFFVLANNSIVATLSRRILRFLSLESVTSWVSSAK